MTTRSYDELWDIWMLYHEMQERKWVEMTPYLSGPHQGVWVVVTPKGLAEVERLKRDDLLKLPPEDA